MSDICVWRLGEREKDGRVKEQYEKLLEVEIDLCSNLEETILTIKIPSGDWCKASLAR